MPFGLLAGYVTVLYEHLLHFWSRHARCHISCGDGQEDSRSGGRLDEPSTPCSTAYLKLGWGLGLGAEGLGLEASNISCLPPMQSTLRHALPDRISCPQARQQLSGAVGWTVLPLGEPSMPSAEAVAEGTLTPEAGAGSLGRPDPAALSSGTQRVGGQGQVQAPTRALDQ